jgi:hypothetical protein
MPDHHHRSVDLVTHSVDYAEDQVGETSRANLKDRGLGVNESIWRYFHARGRLVATHCVSMELSVHDDSSLELTESASPIFKDYR